MWQNRIFILAGLLVAVLLSSTAIRAVVSLGTSEKPTPPGHFEIPPFAGLVECDAHFSNEILRIKNGLPAANTEADLPALYRNYRRLHRLMRQVGRHDGIPPAQQTERLRQRVQQLHSGADISDARLRNQKCHAMAKMPIARIRFSQRVIGH